MHSSPRYKLLILDFDGTLAETLKAVTHCMGKVFERFGEPPPTKAAVRATMGLSLEIAIQQLLGKESSPAALSEWVNCYRTIYIAQGDQQTYLFAGAKDLLAWAAEMEILPLVVSNKGSVAIAAALTRLEVAPFIPMTLAGDTTVHRKPDARLYHVDIKSRFPNVEDREVLVIGDTETDIRFAKNASLCCCWAAYGYGNRPGCLRLKPDFVIEKLQDLIPHLIS